MFDPFCDHALTAKVPSAGSYKTCTAAISDFYSYIPTTDSGNSDEYIAVRRQAGLLDFNCNAEMTNGVISLATNVTDSAYYSTITDLQSYRVVCSAVRVTYIGAPLNAQGFFRIFKISGGSIGSTSSDPFPTSLSTLSGNYYDFTATQLMEGVTVFLNKISPNAKVLNPLTSTDVAASHEQFAIIGTGLSTTGTLIIESRQVIEFTAKMGSTAALVATPNHKETPWYSTLASHMASAIPFIEGSVQKVGAAVKTHASSGLKQLASTGFKYAIGKATQAIESGLADGFELLPELAGAAALL